MYKHSDVKDCFKMSETDKQDTLPLATLKTDNTGMAIKVRWNSSWDLKLRDNEYENLLAKSSLFVAVDRSVPEYVRNGDGVEQDGVAP